MTHDFSYGEALQKVTVTVNGNTVELAGCSFRGVPFFFEDASKGNAGRQIVSKPIPFSSDHSNEDVGLSVPEYAVNFYLVGADCDSQRADLEEAFCEEGTGELIHPYYGRFQARCKGYSISYKRDEAEYLTGSVTFVAESDTPEKARTRQDLHGVTKDAAEDALDGAKSRFVASFSLASRAKSIVDAVSDFTDGVIESVNEARASLRSVSEFVGEVSKVRANLAVILETGDDFAARLQNLLTMTKETLGLDGGDPKDYVNESLTMMDGSSAASAGASPVADDLIALIRSLLLVSAAAAAVENLVDCDFSSSADASEYQDRIHSAFTAALGSVDCMEDYQELQGLEAAALKYLRDSMAGMATIVEYALPAPTNVLAVCYDLYGSLDGVDDIVERNALPFPGMILRGTLKVRSV